MQNCAGQGITDRMRMRQKEGQEREEMPGKKEEKELQEIVQKQPENGFGRGFAAGVLASVLAGGVFFAGWNAARQLDADQSTGEAETENGAEVLTDGTTLHKLDEVQSLIEEYYLKDVDEDLLSTYLFKGIAAGLDDVYANYYSEQELESVLDSSRGSYTGIGAVLSQDTQTKVISVNEVYENTPASEAGLQTGDELLAVDDTELSDMQLGDLVTLIKSREGSFSITVYRPTIENEVTLSVTTGDVEVPNVSYEMKQDGIGYIRIEEFTEAAVDQFREAAENLLDQDMQALIVDLRDNPGGLLDSVCDILDEVLPEKLLVYTEDKNGEREEYYSDQSRTVDCEIAVLVNGGSASASEIFAGAMQDYEMGPVIGTKTYGKGVVQRTFPLSDGSAFKMTVETYYTPNGQDIDGNGITPDIEVEEPEQTKEQEAQTKTEQKEEADPVLEKALEVLKADLAEAAQE